LLAGAADTTVKEISTPQELVNLMKKAEGYDWTGSYKLINDVSLEGFDQNPIGTESDPFMGAFDGGENTVSGISISGSGSLGLFGYTSGATIKNLTVSGNVSGSDTYVGGLIGQAKDGLTVDNCVNACTVTGKGYVGGVLGGYPAAGGAFSITKCHNKGTVTASSAAYVGGIVGYLIGNDTSKATPSHVVTECLNSGNIVSTRTSTSNLAYAGGIIGYLKSVGNVSDCLNTGAVTTNCTRIGGIFGGAETYLGASNNLNKTAVSCAYYDQLTDKSKGYVNSVGGYLASRPTGNNYYVGTLQGTEWLNTTTGGKSTQYTADAFEALNTSGKWVIAEDPELKAFHSHKISEKYIALGGENEGYHAPVCACGDANTADLNGKAEHTIGDDGLCTVCGYYSSNIFTIVYVLNGGEFIKEVPTSYTAGTALSLPTEDAFCESLYTFLGWYDNEALEGDPVLMISEKMSGNKKYYAAWKAPTEIRTAADLAAITSLSDKYILMADIDMSGVAFAPLGGKYEPFTGVFDGNGHTVSNLVIESTASYQGLFAYNRGKITGLTLDNTCAVTGSAYIGGIAGRSDGIIENCTDNATVTVAAGEFVNATYKIMQQNLWVENNGDNAVANRGPKMLQRIYNNDPDFITFQEGSAVWQTYLNESLDGYTIIAQNRGPSDKEAVPVAFKTAKFDLVESGHFWLSETPDEVSLGWGASFLRICTYVVVRDKTTGNMFAIYSIHLDHQVLEARTEGAKLVISRMEAIEEKYPNIILIAAGDFNGTSVESFYDTFTTYPYVDARTAAKETTDEVTFTDEYGARIIDFIFVNSDKTEVSKFAVLSETIDGQALSDHNGTYAEIKPRHELDLNEDGIVSLADIAEFIKVAKTGDNNSSLDLICDGTLDSKDLLALMKVVAASDTVGKSEDTNDTLTLSLDGTTDNEKRTVTLTVNATTAGNGFVAAKFNVSAPEGFTLADVNADALVDGGYICAEGQNIVVSKTDGTNGSVNGELLTLTYSIGNTVAAGEYTFELTALETVDADGKYLAASASGAEVTVEACKAVAGDIDGDGDITVNDVVKLVDVVLNEQYSEKCDFNGDGKVSLVDIIHLMTLAAK
nr:InlB B-repeat-containing protein [Clostridia bacterium]